MRVLQSADRSASLYVGHDMHGLLPARLLASWYRRPLVYHCHDFAESERSLPLGSRVVRTFERHFAHTADLVIVPDAERGREISKQLRLRKPPLVVANAPLSRSHSSGEALSQALAVQGRRFGRVVWRQGRIGPGHAIEATVRSIRFWASREWGFVVMGLCDEGYRNFLGRLAAELGVTGQFAIMPPVPYDRVAEFTTGAHVGHALYEPIHINHRYYTTASNKIMEYMAAGLPLLVSDRAGLRSFIQEYQCGLTADEGSPQSIADAVNALLGDEELAGRMGAAGAKAFEDELNYERQFAPVLQAFRSLTRTSGAHTP